jgi:catechol 2,3-dioxygenase-like lactoylglutathione lyase family enzyme
MGLQDSRVEAAVAVSDLPRARHFYEEQLGLVPDEVEEAGTHYSCAQGTAIFVYLAPDHAGRNPATAAGFYVADLDATMADLGSRGVEFERYEGEVATDERGVFDSGSFRAAWVRDPDGNTLALTQPYE